MRNRSEHNRYYRSRSSHINEDLTNAALYRLFPEMKNHDKAEVRGINMVPTNARQCRVRCDGEKVYADTKFYPGDIVEICPCREISKQSLYTRDVRDIVFEVVKNRQYVIPMGYCQYYSILDSFHREPNCNWEWDAHRNAIVIRAIIRIQKDDELVLDVEK